MLSAASIEKLRSDALAVPQPTRENHYIPLKDAHGNHVGYATFRTIDGKLRLTTILGKEMSPKGSSLGHVLHQKTAEVETELQPHQKRVVERLLAKGQPGLVAMHGLGSGKTLTSIAVADALGMPADVVLPAALRANYVKELAKHTPETPPEAHIQSLENVSRKQLPLKNPLLIVDEAHRGRNPSKTQRALRQSEAKKRLLLTGSLFYNQPSDVAAPVNIAAGAPVLPSDPEEFRRTFVTEHEERPGLIGKLMGKSPRVVYGVNPQKREYLQNVLKKYVDYHPGSKENFPAREDQTIDVTMGPRQKEIYDALIGRAPAWVLERVRSGLPPSKSEMSQLNRFLQGTRQVASSTAPYHVDRPPEQPKLDRAVAELEKTLGANPRAKAIIYSNYLDAALGPYKELMAAKGIPYGEFTGAMSKATRDQMVRDYNENKIRALLLSRAGGEGLDLKGTRLIQLLEPHWNEEALKQVIGRGIRYKSHEHLPEDERKVLVQRFIAKNPRKGVAQRLHLKDPERSVEDYLMGLAQQKEELNEQFRKLLE
jgi:superfamily II DNA or RNA helicase